MSDDSNDPFNDKVTAKIDELNERSEKKFSALDQLTSPQGFVTAAARMQNTGSTAASGAMPSQTGLDSSEAKAVMIDTTGGAAKATAFDTGLPNGSSDNRIDLSSLIEDGNQLTKQVAVSQQS